MIVVHVRWFDSCMTLPETRAADDLPGIAEMESAGMLVDEDDDSITLALDRSMGTGGLRSMICIPKVNVRKIRRIKVN